MAELASLIAQLADPDPAVREAAANSLYELGRSLAQAATQSWRADAQLTRLLTGPPTVGTAVTPGNFAKIHAAFGSPRLADVPPDQDAREFELHLGPARLDILTTRATSNSGTAPGAIARFLERFGEGIQQVEYPTSDVDRASQLLRTRFRLEPVYPQTRPGTDGTRINFFLVPAPDGRKVLIELVETPETSGG